MSEWIKVKDKKELARLIASGGKWEGKSGVFNGFCYWNASFINPFRYAAHKESVAMGWVWEIKQWRRLEYQPKNGELIWAWNRSYNTHDRATLCIFGKADIHLDSFAPFHEPPEFIQKMIDAAKDTK